MCGETTYAPGDPVTILAIVGRVLHETTTPTLSRPNSLRERTTKPRLRPIPRMTPKQVKSDHFRVKVKSRRYITMVQMCALMCSFDHFVNPCFDPVSRVPVQGTKQLHKRDTSSVCGVQGDTTIPRLRPMRVPRGYSHPSDGRRDRASLSEWGI